MPSESIDPSRIPRTTAPLVEGQCTLASNGMKSSVASAVQARRLSDMKLVERACAGAPDSTGPSEAPTHTLARATKLGFAPIRSNKYRQKAAKSDINAASVTKHLQASFHDVSGPHTKPISVIAGG